MLWYIIFLCMRLRYSAFKVQNINDCYMVASGVPLAVGKKLGNMHASVIATMALDILAGSAMFVIPHKPTEKLLLRIAIHSGPAIGGVQPVCNNVVR